MTGRRLIISGSWPRQRPLTNGEFLWRAAHSETSFHTRLGPQLANIGAVPEPNIDLVALSVLTFLADRTVPRPKDWAREIDLDIPVYGVDDWQGLAPNIAATLEFLTADSWTLDFRTRTAAKARKVANRPPVDRVLLFSGGADSLCGAVRSLSAGERLLLVSHWDWGGHSARQKTLARWLARRFPDQVYMKQHWIARRSKQLGGAAAFGDEATRRSRSLLFIALGLAHAAVDPPIPLWLAENGYAALNPPLAGERRGALSTRTTHPLVLDQLRRSIAAVNGYSDVSNPFAAATKGEMYAVVADLLGKSDAETLLARSHSCSHVRWATGTGFSPDTQCGVCFGCLVRRSAFLAAGLQDRTIYLHTAIELNRQSAQLRRAARDEVLTVRYAGSRGFTAADLLSVGLPDYVSLDDAIDIANRGLRELATVADTAADLAGVA
jgi:7-cyano-7-deazaguanine synthase in queuosine biosynthesis